jgi:hypothetical protein
MGKRKKPRHGRDWEGSEALRRLSDRIRSGEEGGKVTDEEIVEAVGADLLDAFRYAQEALRGRVRKLAGEPFFCHVLDSTLRCVDLGYDPAITSLCLLHDVVEELSRDLPGVAHHLDQIQALFGAHAARGTRLLTNRYAIIVEALMRRGLDTLLLDAPSLKLVQRALGELQKELDDDCRQRFSSEFGHVERLLCELDLAQNRGPDQTLLGELKLAAYSLYVQEMADDASHRIHYGAYGEGQAVLTAKSMDMIDNLRTADISTLSAINRLVHKTEVFLDRTFWLHEVILNGAGRDVSTFTLVYDYLKAHMVAQLNLRHRAVQIMSDTRFERIADHLEQQIERLRDKYKLGEHPEEVINRLRRQIRQRNMNMTMDTNME